MHEIAIDAKHIVELVRKIAGRLAAIIERPDPDQPLQAVIDWVRHISAQASQELRTTLAIDYPGIGWRDEEDIRSKGSRSYWLYDPIDGAYHFIQGLPLWSSSLALIVRGEPVFSVVHDPTLTETFQAERGRGASCNGKPLSVSRKQSLGTAVLGASIPPLAQVGRAERDHALALLKAASDTAFVIRPMAAVSLQLAYLAAGRLDGFWETGNDLADWLAGSLLVAEAGGMTTTLAGGDIGTGDGILAGNRALCGDLQRIFHDHPRDRAV